MNNGSFLNGVSFTSHNNPMGYVYLFSEYIKQLRYSEVTIPGWAFPVRKEQRQNSNSDLYGDKFQNIMEIPRL